MEKKLSEIYLQKNQIVGFGGVLVLRIEDVKTYGEIKVLEHLYSNTVIWIRADAKIKLQEIAQEHGITDYKL